VCSSIRRFQLAHVLRKKGEQMSFLYDFSDQFYHHIELVDIIPAKDSNGRIKVNSIFTFRLT
jgi:hypothetical protein